MCCHQVCGVRTAAFNNAIFDAAIWLKGKLHRKTYTRNSISIRILMLDLITFVAVTTEWVCISTHTHTCREYARVVPSLGMKSVKKFCGKTKMRNVTKRLLSDWKVSDIIFGWLDILRCSCSHRHNGDGHCWHRRCWCVVCSCTRFRYDVTAHLFELEFNICVSHERTFQ